VTPRIAFIGHGAIGRSTARALAPDFALGPILLRRPADIGQLEAVFSVADLIAARPDLVVECAGHGVVGTVLPEILSAGIPAVVASIGALGDPNLRQRLADAARAGGTRAILVSGAVGGLDALSAARGARLAGVVYTGRKPPAAWRGSAGEAVAMAGVEAVVFEGNAAEACRLFPRNANVAAAVALAGLGFEATEVTLVSDPAITANVHEIFASGDFGEFRMRLANSALPDNPRSSWLSALSVEAAVRRHFDPLSL
jgi:aspartate dehydrogenase